MKRKLILCLLSIFLSAQCTYINVNAESDINKTDNIEILKIERTDKEPVEITLTEGESIQILIDNDLMEKDYVSFYSETNNAIVSNDLKITGISEGDDTLYVYAGRYSNAVIINVHVLKNELLSAENRIEIERLKQCQTGLFLRKRAELSGALNKNAPRLNMEKVNEIINDSSNFQEILRRFNQYHSYPDTMPNGSGNTEYSYWLDEKGKEYISLFYENESIAYYITNDNGYVVAAQRLYPEKEATDLFELKFINHSYIEYNQIQSEGYGTVIIDFIDETTNEGFTDSSGTFQLVAKKVCDGELSEDIIKTWNADDGNRMIISELSVDCMYEVKYIDHYHGDDSYKYLYQIDINKQTHFFSFSHVGDNNKETDLKIYMKKRNINDPFKPGDVNLDDNFDISDILIVKKYLLGISDERMIVPEYADFSGDGIINIADFCMMKSKLVDGQNY